MPIPTAQKVVARLADLLGVSRSQVTRWLRGSGEAAQFFAMQVAMQA